MPRNQLVERRSASEVAYLPGRYSPALPTTAPLRLGLSMGRRMRCPLPIGAAVCILAICHKMVHFSILMPLILCSMLLRRCIGVVFVEVTRCATASVFEEQTNLDDGNTLELDAFG